MKGIKCPKICFEKMSIKKTDIFGVFFVVPIIFFFTSGFAEAFDPTFGAGDKIVDAFKAALISFGVSVIGLIFWVWNFIGIILMFIASFVLQHIMTLVLSWDYLPSNNSAIGVIWLLLRDLANMALIFVLLYIGIGTILNIRVISKKNTYKSASTLLVPFFVCAVLIHFTPLIAGIVIDISHIFTKYFFVAAQDGLSGFGSSHPFSDNWKGFVWTSSLEEASGIVLQSIVSIFYSLTVAVVLLIVAAILIVRIVALNLLVSVSPIAFLARIIPQTSKSIFEPWKTQLLQWAMLPVILGLFLWMSVVVLDNGRVACQESPLDMGAPGNPTTPIVATANQVLPSDSLCMSIVSMMSVIIVIVGLFVSSKTSAMGASTIISAGKKVTTGVVKRGVAGGLLANARFLGMAGRGSGELGRRIGDASLRFGRGGGKWRKPFAAGGYLAGSALKGAGDLGRVAGYTAELGVNAGRYINYDKSKGLTFDSAGYTGSIKDDLFGSVDKDGNPIKGKISGGISGIGDAKDSLLLREGRVRRGAGALQRGLSRAGMHGAANKVEDQINKDRIKERATQRGTERIGAGRKAIEGWTDDQMMNALATKPGALADKTKDAQIKAAILEQKAGDGEFMSKVRSNDNIKNNLRDAKRIARQEGFEIQNEDVAKKGVTASGMIDAVLQTDAGRRESQYEEDRAIQSNIDKHHKDEFKKYTDVYKDRGLKGDQLLGIFNKSGTDNEKLAAMSLMFEHTMNDAMDDIGVDKGKDLVAMAKGLGLDAGEGQGRHSLADKMASALVESNPDANISEEIKGMAQRHLVTMDDIDRVDIANQSKENIIHKATNLDGDYSTKQQARAIGVLAQEHGADEAEQLFAGLEATKQQELAEHFSKSKESFAQAGRGKNKTGGFSSQQLGAMLSGSKEDKKKIQHALVQKGIKKSGELSREELRDKSKSSDIVDRTVAVAEAHNRGDNELLQEINVTEKASEMKDMLQGLDIATHGGQLSGKETDVSINEIIDAHSGEGDEVKQKDIMIRGEKARMNTVKKALTDRGKLRNPSSVRDVIQDQKTPQRDKLGAIATVLGPDVEGGIDMVRQSIDAGAMDIGLARSIKDMARSMPDVPEYQNASKFIDRHIKGEGSDMRWMTPQERVAFEQRERSEEAQRRYAEQTPETKPVSPEEQSRQPRRVGKEPPERQPKVETWPEHIRRERLRRMTPQERVAFEQRERSEEAQRRYAEQTPETKPVSPEEQSRQPRRVGKEPPERQPKVETWPEHIRRERLRRMTPQERVAFEQRERSEEAQRRYAEQTPETKPVSPEEQSRQPRRVGKEPPERQPTQQDEYRARYRKFLDEQANSQTREERTVGQRDVSNNLRSLQGQVRNIYNDVKGKRTEHNIKNAREKVERLLQQRNVKNQDREALQVWQEYLNSIGNSSGIPSTVEPPKPQPVSPKPQSQPSPPPELTNNENVDNSSPKENLPEIELDFNQNHRNILRKISEGKYDIPRSRGRRNERLKTLNQMREIAENNPSLLSSVEKDMLLDTINQLEGK